MDESPVNMIIDGDPLVPPIQRRRAPRAVSDHLPISPLGVLSSPEDSTWILNNYQANRFTAVCRTCHTTGQQPHHTRAIFWLTQVESTWKQPYASYGTSMVRK